MNNKVIEVKNLIKKYEKLTAVNDISFEVNKGEVFGLLGENGAGKTTTLEIIEGLRRPTSGEISVLGHNVKNDLGAIKQRIGVQLQSSAYYNYLTLAEILRLFGSFYPRRVEAEKLLKMVGLTGKAKTYVSRLSGGQKQRFSIIASLVNDPEIIFLDEPTTGLDPLARRNLWDLVMQIKSQGKTIILTTHYMEEAEILCDRIAIMDKGKILLMGDTHKLIENAKDPIKVNFLARNIDQNILKEILTASRMQDFVAKDSFYEIRVKSQTDLNMVLTLIQKLNPESLTVCRATLEDLFLELTGKTIKE